MRRIIKYLLIGIVLAVISIECYRNVEVSCDGWAEARFKTGRFSEGYVQCRIIGWHYFMLKDLGLK